MAKREDREETSDDELDEDEESESEQDDESEDESEQDETESEDEESDDEESEDEESDATDQDSDEDRDVDEDERDVSAARVAKALGVDEEEAAEAEQEKEIAKNRAARRREEAQQRRRRKKGEDEDEDEGPRDRNKRAKELLSRRRKEAEEEPEVGLAASEMVEDSLARGTAAASRWFRENFKIIQWVLIAGALTTAGVLYWVSEEEQTAGVASGDLHAGVAADLGRVVKEDTRTDEQKKLDPTLVYTSNADRTKAALASYNKVIDAHPGTGAAILAKLGQAGAYLSDRQYGPALDAFNEVASSPLAGADEDVKARALEGAGYALEGKEDPEGALKKFKEIGHLKGDGFSELSKYHEGRLLLAKGELDQAKEILLAVREKLQLPESDGARLTWLKDRVEDNLRVIDPSLAPKTASPFGGAAGGSVGSPEELQKLMEEMKKMQEGKSGPGAPGGPAAPPGGSPAPAPPEPPAPDAPKPEAPAPKPEAPAPKPPAPPPAAPKPPAPPPAAPAPPPPAAPAPNEGI